jgi:ribulose-phosphate 3-epimerase
MDGHFVPNLTIGPMVVKALRPHSAKPFDVHLMVSPADALVEAFAEAGADILSVHPESGPHLHRTLMRIRALGKKAGVVLNPATPLECLDHVMDLLDLVLVMSVNPGFGGQSFIEGALPKIAAIRRRIDASGKAIELEVDGGVDAGNAARVVAAGATVLVAGHGELQGRSGKLSCQYCSPEGRACDDRGAEGRRVMAEESDPEALRLTRDLGDRGPSLAERLGERLDRLAFQSPLHRMRLKGRFPLKLLAVPEDPVPGDLRLARG